MKRLIPILLLLVEIISCQAQDCGKLPEHFTSYSQAIQLVKSRTFKINETANVSNSSWIKFVNYYSCDGNTGYLIYTTNRGYEYIHAGVPLYVWKGFKNASSKGSYYDGKIKGRYQLQMR
jgi:hypothetical protein